MLGSTVCRYEHLHAPWFTKWNAKLGSHQIHPVNPGLSYRKIWEWCAITEVLHSRGMLASDRKGLGFAVGSEALPALFAAYGVEVLATDLAPDLSQEHWLATGQHAASVDGLYREDLLNRSDFDRLVSFQHADMRTLQGLPCTTFDFVWSSCSLEHLGTIEDSFRFIEAAMDLLKPGGIAVHTTEYNVSSNEDTILEGNEVIFRRQDIERIDHRLRNKECGLDRVDFYPGNHEHDLACDNPPFLKNGRMHLKLRLFGYVTTSILFIAFKP